MIVQFPSNNKLFIPKHAALPDWQEDIIMLWGGRYGAKSESIARLLTKKALADDYFKCVLSRKVKDTVKESNFEQVKGFIESHGLDPVFKFRKSPLEIETLNKRRLIARGFDDPKKYKGIREPSSVWAEEAAELTSGDFETALTTLRVPLNFRKTVKPQMFLSFNPEVDGDFNDFWLYNRFFADKDSYDFVDVFETNIGGRDVKYKVRSVHTTYRDNPFVDDVAIAIIEDYKRKYLETGSQEAKYFYDVWSLGNWGKKLPNNPYLHEFSELKHVEEIEFNHDSPVHVGFDENTNPYQPASIFQIKGDKLIQVSEFALPHPNNRIRVCARKIHEQLRRANFKPKMFVYGDATSKKNDSAKEAGSNFFTIAIDELKKGGYRITNRVPGMRSESTNSRRKRNNPNPADSGDFLNYLIENERIVVSISCVKSIADYVNCKQSNDGGIDKKEKDKKTGGDKWGHFTDILRYVACELFYDEYMLFISVKDKKHVTL